MAKYKGKFQSGKVAHEAGHTARPSSPQAETAAPKKKKKGGTALRVVLIVLLVIIIAAAAVLIYANTLLNKLDRTSMADGKGKSYAELLGEGPQEGQDEESARQMQAADEAFKTRDNQQLIEEGGTIENYLIIGTDRRDSGYYGNSDTMIILSLNTETKKIHLTSLMRAMYVSIPDPKGTVNGMLNWAYSMGGPELLMDTIEENFRVHIDHYAAVDFNSFEDVIDAVGGVSIDLSSSEASYIYSDSGEYYEPGTQTLNGKAALSYARCRKLDNDFIRTNRQRNVLEGVIHSLSSLSVGQLTNLANVLFPAITTDMTNGEILEKIVNVSAYSQYPVDQMMLPVENQDGQHYDGIFYLNGHEMYEVNWDTNLEALREFITN